MPATAHGTFTVELVPGRAELDGLVSRMDFTKTFEGDLAAASRGFLVRAGDPRAGAAGYVAIETVEGRLHDVAGGFALQQSGTMDSGEQTLEYRIVPGSGSGALERISGRLELTIEPDGTHRFVLRYQL